MKKAEDGKLPDIKKEKEENLDKVLNAADEYYKTDEDPEIKSSQSKDICDSLLNLIDDLSKPGLLDTDKKPEEEDDKKPEEKEGKKPEEKDGKKPVEKEGDKKPEGKDKKLPGKLDPSRIPKAKKKED